MVVGPASCPQTARDRVLDQLLPVKRLQDASIKETSTSEGRPEEGGDLFEQLFGRQDISDSLVDHFDSLVDHFDFDKWASLAPIAAVARRRAAHPSSGQRYPNASTDSCAQAEGAATSSGLKEQGQHPEALSLQAEVGQSAANGRGRPLNKSSLRDKIRSLEGVPVKQLGLPSPASRTPGRRRPSASTDSSSPRACLPNPALSDPALTGRLAILAT